MSVVLSGYQAFKWWVAIKQHFHQKSFDVFKTRNRVKCSETSFEQRIDSPTFERLASKFEPRDFVMFVASNIMYGNQQAIWESKTGIANYNLFVSRRAQIDRIVDHDLNKLYNLHIQLNDGVSIIRALTRNEITFETVAIINQYTNLTDQLRGTPCGDLLEPLLLRIDKSKGFVRISTGVDKLLKLKTLTLK